MHFSLHFCKVAEQCCDCRWEFPQQRGGHENYSLTLTTLLCLLVVLHAYWFHLILKIALEFVRTGTKRDVRESKD